MSKPDYRTALYQRWLDGSLKKPLTHFQTLTIWEAILRSDPCSYCGQWPAGGVDHIESVLRFHHENHLGPRMPQEEHRQVGNMTACCRRCNRAKSSTPVLHFLLGGNGLMDEKTLDQQVVVYDTAYSPTQVKAVLLHCRGAHGNKAHCRSIPAIRRFEGDKR